MIRVVEVAKSEISGANLGIVISLALIAIGSGFGLHFGWGEWGPVMFMPVFFLGSSASMILRQGRELRLSRDGLGWANRREEWWMTWEEVEKVIFSIPKGIVVQQRAGPTKIIRRATNEQIRMLVAALPPETSVLLEGPKASRVPRALWAGIAVLIGASGTMVLNSFFQNPPQDRIVFNLLMLGIFIWMIVLVCVAIQSIAERNKPGYVRTKQMDRSSPTLATALMRRYILGPEATREFAFVQQPKVQVELGLFKWLFYALILITLLMSVFQRRPLVDTIGILVTMSVIGWLMGWLVRTDILNKPSKSARIRDRIILSESGVFVVDDAGTQPIHDFDWPGRTSIVWIVRVNGARRELLASRMFPIDSPPKGAENWLGA